MPYKNKEAEREAARVRMRKYRQGVTEGVTSNQGVTEGVEREGVTSGVTKGQGVTYPPLLYKLADPVQCGKLKAISDSLKIHNLGSHVWMGSQNFDEIGTLLEAFE